MGQNELEITGTAAMSATADAARQEEPAQAAPRAQAAGRRARQIAVSVFHLDTGGCGACAQSVYALLAPRYAGALRAEGIMMARSPRHADIALITGAMSRAARAAALRTLDATPYPHALVAVGDCAIDGCVFRGSPLLIKDPAEALDANVEIAGCPPAPDAILAAIVEAKHLLSGDGADDDADEAHGVETDGASVALAEAPHEASAMVATSADDAEDDADALDDDFDESDESDDNDFDETDGDEADAADEDTEEETKGGRA